MKPKKILRLKDERAIDEAMKTKTEKVLPKTAREIANGGVYAQAVRCGRSNCRCSGGDTHTAFYFFTRRNGKLVKMYVRKAEVERFSRLAEIAAVERKAQRRMSKANFELLREFRQVLSEKQSLINSMKGALEND